MTIWKSNRFIPVRPAPKGWAVSFCFNWVNWRDLIGNGNWAAISVQLWNNNLWESYMTIWKSNRFISVQLGLNNLRESYMAIQVNQWYLVGNGNWAAISVQLWYNNLWESYMTIRKSDWFIWKSNRFIPVWLASKGWAVSFCFNWVNWRNLIGNGNWATISVQLWYNNLWESYMTIWQSDGVITVQYTTRNTGNDKHNLVV